MIQKRDIKTGRIQKKTNDEFLNEFFINIRENYHPANLFNVFPYLIHSVILWWFLSLFYLIFFHKKTGMIESLNDIDGDM